MKSNQMNRTTIGMRALVCGLLAALPLAASHAQDERGKQLYVNCVACHGAEGQGMKLMNSPALSNLSEKAIIQAFNQFKVGHRGKVVGDTTGLMMAPMTQMITSDADLAAVAKHIVSLGSKPLEQTITDGNAERGKMLYMTCQACHGAAGEGNDLMNSPALRHQHDWYLAAQLKKFKDGVRGSNPADIYGSQMRPMAMILADEQAIKDVVAYIQTLSK